ncbi:MAG: UMP kinase [Acidilobaceae archaeon]
MEWLVVKVSGRLLNPPSPQWLEELRRSVEESLARVRLAFVVGGGPLARSYIQALRPLGVPESLLDSIGVKASRLNAYALALSLQPYASLKVPETVEEAVEEARRGSVPVMGGLQPGQSTNAVSVSLAEALRARVVLNLLADIDGVYVPPPGRPGSRLVEWLTYEEMEKLISEYSQIAGAYELFDLVALKIAERSGVKVFFTNGRNPRVIASYARGEKIAGTMLGASGDP